jgi:inhibitor of KinA sporulation pathway (predicted exonuclease)
MSLLLIIDLEATCDVDHGIPRSEMEIIEIGAVIVDLSSASVIDSAQFYIHPVVHRALTPFCTALTGIQQETVDHAPYFHEAIEQLRTWMQPHVLTAWGSWGGYDRNQMMQDCERHHIPYPLEGLDHINLKNAFGKANGFKRKGLKNAFIAINKADEMTGRQHSGLDDARNMAKLVELSPKFKNHLLRLVHPAHSK